MAGLAVSCTLGLALSIAIAAAYRAVLRLSPLDHPLPVILPPPPKLVGPFSPNSLLHHVRRIGDGQLLKPEDIAVDGQGLLYVGCEDGWIKRVEPNSNKVENWIHIVGGRPLGLAMGRNGELIVCEPSMGLLNVTRDKVEVLSDEAEGVKFKLTDAAAVATDGLIYFTDASHKYPYGRYILDILEGRPNGRLLRYDPATRSTTVLIHQLYFANGVALSGDERFLVVCETTLARCQRYWLKGEKAGNLEMFVDNLPAFPDNVKNDGKGHFWIGLLWERSYHFSNVVLKYPFLKHLQVVLGFTKHINKQNKRALVLSLNEEGVPLSTFGDPNGEVIEFVTTALVIGDDMYLGNLGVDFLGHLKMNSTG